MKTMKMFMTGICMGGLVLGICSFAGAQSAVDKPVSKPLGIGGPREKDFDWKKLEQLKKDDPERFNALLKQRHEQRKQQLEQLKKTDPKKYEEIMQSMRQKRHERLLKLRAENPEKFKEFVEKRKAALQERLEKLKVDDPQKYAQIMAKRQKMQELRKLRQEDPQKFEQYLKDHPELAERMKQFHQKRKGFDFQRGMKPEPGKPPADQVPSVKDQTSL